MNVKVFKEGVKDGIPIGLGYFAVSFSLGIAARNSGLNAFQGFLASLLINASAGEYALFKLIGENAAYLDVVLMTLIANGRYLLMSCVLGQKFSPKTPFYHRLLVAFDVTDEIFAISAAREGYLNPFYNYGAMAVALPGWSIGTALGIMAGNALSPSIVCALSVALFGMFIAIIIPPAKENKTIGLLVIISFILSGISSIMPILSNLSSGTKTIILTVAISTAAAILKPVEGEETANEK